MAYRILSLDGGGSWALIEVKALIGLYGGETRGHRILMDFDLVAANSGGSIVLGCLIEDMSLRQILHFFESVAERETVFSPTRKLYFRFVNLVKALRVFPRYSANHKLPAIERVLAKTGKTRLDQISSKVLERPVHLLITSFDYDRCRSTFFRSAQVASSKWGTGAATALTLAQAVHASSNAPVKYFDGPAVIPNHANRYWDGGVAGCNNPVLAAVTEALGLGVEPLDIVALSLGAAQLYLPQSKPGDAPSPLLLTRSKAWWPHDLSNVAGAILDDPPDAASFLAHVMTGSGEGLTLTLPSGGRVNSRIVRMNPLISPVMRGGKWCAPGDWTMAQFSFVADLEMDAVQEREVQAIMQYADLWLNDDAPNQPVRLDGNTLECELGQSTFQDALQAWKLLSHCPAHPWSESLL